MFDYLCEKITNADFQYKPFKHIEINNFFTNTDFKNIIEDNQINFPKFESDEKLINFLENENYKSIQFPGCITNSKDYINWHTNKKGINYNVNTTEGFGMTYRLMKPNSVILNNLINFFDSNIFKKAIADKFSINLQDVTFDQGIQKYLDGYEISPHPDIRLKALTYMININPNKDSENLVHHTHYMKFKKEFKYVEEYWKGNNKSDRCWVPWSWCETEKIQKINNSMVIFAPDNNTLHAVKTNYSHLDYQRTQIYGNFWWNKSLDKIQQIKSQPKWENYVINQSKQKPREKIITKISNKLKNLFQNS